MAKRAAAKGGSNEALDRQQTAKVAKVDLERLLEEERQRLRSEERAANDDHTMVMAETPCDVPPSQETTVRLQAPELPPDLPSPLGSDFPPPMPELTAVMKFTPVPIPPPPLPPFEVMREARHEAQKTKRVVVAIWAFALTLAGTLGYFVAAQS